MHQWAQASCTCRANNSTINLPLAFSDTTKCQGVASLGSGYPSSGAGAFHLVSINQSSCTCYGDYCHDSFTTQGHILVLGI